MLHILSFALPRTVKVDESRYTALFVQRIYQKAFLSWLRRYLYFLKTYFFNRFCRVEKNFVYCLCQDLSFLNIFFNRFCPTEKCGIAPSWDCFMLLDHFKVNRSVFLYKSSHRRCSERKVFSEILQNSQENTCCLSLFFNKVAGLSTGVFLWILRNFLKRLF